MAWNNYIHYDTTKNDMTSPLHVYVHVIPFERYKDFLIFKTSAEIRISDVCGIDYRNCPRYDKPFY